MIKLNLDSVCFTEKPNKNELRNISNRIASQTVDCSISTIANKVGNNGQTFTPAIFKHQYRKAANFESMQLFALDFDDENITYAEIKRRANEYQIPFAFSYKTFSYTNEHERFRMVFLLDLVITDKNIAEMVIFILSKLFPECDKSCKDISRMFLGGIGTLDVPEEILSLKALTDVFQKSKSDNDGSGHFKRDMQNFSRKYRVGVTAFSLIDIAYEDGVPKNGVFSPINNYIYISNVDKSPFFCVLKKECTLPETSSMQIKNGTHTNLRSSYLKKALDTCKLLRDAEENIYNLLNHDERLGLLCNLLHIESGSEYFLSLIDRDNSYKYNDWKQQVQYMKRNKYNDISCSKFCKYYGADKCRNTDKSLLYTLKKRDRYEFLDSNMNYTSLDATYHDLQEKFTEAMNAQDKDIHVLEAQTAIGKTSIYTSYIENNYMNSRFLIAVPTNQLKNEVTSVLIKKNIPVVTSTSVTELDCLPFDLREQIQGLYNTGYRGEVKNLLKKLLKKIVKIPQKLHQLEDEIFRLFSFTSLLSDTSTRVVVTTHNMLLYLSQNDMLKKHLNEYQLIIDEDIIPTIVNSQKKILMSDVKWLLDSGLISPKEKTRKSLEFLKSIPLDKPMFYTGAPINIDFKIQDQYYLGSNFNDMRPGSILIKSQFDKETRIQYFYPYKLPYQKAVILSATSSSYIYKNYFKDRTVDYIICKKAVLKGHIYQFPFHSCSRNSLKKKDKKKLYSHIREQHGNIPVISFKEYNFDELHFGNTEGTNIYEGKNIAILGTPHLNSNVYIMLAFSIDHNVQTENIYMRKVTYKDIRFPFMTYKNVLLRNIQIYFISKELEQAVGRARALRYNSNVYVYSDFPVEQAEFMMDDYLV